MNFNEKCYDENGKIENGLYIDSNYVTEQEKSRLEREKMETFEYRELKQKEANEYWEKQQEKWRIEEAETLKHNERYSEYLQEQFNELRNQIFSRTETEYVESVPTKEYYESVEVNEEMKTRAFFELADGFLVNKNSQSFGISAIEGNLKILANDKKLITKLLKVMVYKLYQIRYALNKPGYGLGTSLMDKGSPTDGLKLENYLLTIAIIQEKGYPYNLDELMELEIFMPENPSLKVPLDIAVAYMSETITKNTSANPLVPNPIKMVSNTEGKDEIHISQLSDLIIKSMNSGHKLSDDVKNFPKTETKSK